MFYISLIIIYILVVAGSYFSQKNWNNIKELEIKIDSLLASYSSRIATDIETLLKSFELSKENCVFTDQEFDSHLNKNNIKLTQIQTENLYLNFKTYCILYNRNQKLEALLNIIDTEYDDVELFKYKNAMKNLLESFFIENYDFSNQQEFDHALLSNFKPIPQEKLVLIKNKYDVYIKEIERDNIQKLLLKNIDNREIIPIEEMVKIYNIFEIFQIKYEIGDNIFNLPEEYKTFLSKKFPDFPEEHINILFIHYKTFVTFKKCTDVVNSALYYIKQNHVPDHETMNNKFLVIKSECGLNNEYYSEDDFFTNIRFIYKNINPDIIKTIYPHYKNYAKKVEIEKYAYLVKEITTLSFLNDQMYKISRFDESLNLNSRQISLEDFNEILKLHDIFYDSSDNKYFNIYKKYSDRKQVENLGTSISDRINQNPQLNINNFINDIRKFLALCKLSEEDIFERNVDYANRIKLIHSEFEDEKISIIFNKLNDLRNFKIRKTHRDEIIKYIKATSVPDIYTIIKEMSNFEESHFGINTIEETTFRQKLINEGLSEKDIDLLFLFYKNYKTYIDKVKAVKDLLVKIETLESESIKSIYQIESYINNFIELCHIDFKNNENIFKDYLKKQNLGITEEQIDKIYIKYIEYLDYNDRVDKRKNLIKLIEENVKLSQMVSSIEKLYSVFKFDAVNINDLATFIEYYHPLDPTLQEEKINEIRLKVIAFIKLKERQSTKNELIELLKVYLKLESIELEEKIELFINQFDLKFQTIGDSTSFYEHLITQDELISIEESNVIYNFYKKYITVQNRRNIRNKCFNLITEKENLQDSELFMFLELFVKNYKLNDYNFKNIEEFKILVTDRDYDIQPIHLNTLYTPIVKYFRFVKRRQTYENLLTFKELRLTPEISEVNHYTNQVYDSYLLDEDIINDDNVFAEHVSNLDFTMSLSQIENFQKILNRNMMIIDCINIKNTLLSLIDSIIQPEMENIRHTIDIYISSCNLVGHEVLDMKKYKSIAKILDPTLNDKEIKKIHPFLYKFMENVQKRIAVKVLLGFIKTKNDYKYQEISHLIKSYLNSFNFTISDIIYYESFKQKNLEIEDTSETDIKTLYVHVKKYLKGDEFHKEEESNINQTVGYPGFIKQNIIRGIDLFFFKIFKYLGIYPHMVYNAKSLKDLSSTQIKFDSVYKYLCGINYFFFPSSPRIDIGKLSKK